MLKNQSRKDITQWNPTIQNLKTIYVMYVRSIPEFSAPVWHSSLTEENRNDLERVQKTALKRILGQRFKRCKNTWNILNLETLKERRENFKTSIINWELENLNLMVDFCICLVCPPVNLCMYLIKPLSLSLSLSLSLIRMYWVPSPCWSWLVEILQTWLLIGWERVECKEALHLIS